MNAAADLQINGSCSGSVTVTAAVLCASRRAGRRVFQILFDDAASAEEALRTTRCQGQAAGKMLI